MQVLLRASLALFAEKVNPDGSQEDDQAAEGEPLRPLQSLCN